MKNAYFQHDNVGSLLSNVPGRRKPFGLVLALLLAVATILLVPGPAAAACGGVTNVSNAAELNAAIADFNSQAGACVYTIALTGNIDLLASTTIINNGAAGVELFIDGAGYKVDGQDIPGVRPFEVDANTTVTMQNITVSGGHINLTGDNVQSTGGAILNRGTLTVKESAISGNAVAADGLSSAAFGGGIFTTGSSVLLVTGSKINDNTAAANGGLSSAAGAAIYSDSANVSMTIIDSTLDDNRVTASGNGARAGGGALVLNGPTSITGSTISNNSAINGGAIFNNDDTEIVNSTISGNVGEPGGIYNFTTLKIVNSTLSDNTNTTLFNNNPTASAAVTIHNSIVANSLGGVDCAGSGLVTAMNSLIETTADFCSVSNGVDGNIIGQDPNLGPLHNNGGLTATHALLDNSLAIDSGLNSLAVAGGGSTLLADQRGNGYARIVDNIVDMGAFEVQHATDLKLQQFANPDGLTTAGNPFDFVIYVDNVSSEFAYDVTLKDTLFASGPYTLTAVTDDRVACDVTGPQSGIAGSSLPFSCVLDKLEPGGRWTITALVVSDQAADINNEAHVFAAGQDDAELSNNSGTATMQVAASADISVEKTAEPTPINAGEIAAWTITVHNNGPSTAENVQIHDLLPEAILANTVQILPNTAACTSGTPGEANDPTICNLGDIAKDGEVVLTISGQVDPGYKATPGIINDVAVMSDTHDPNGANDRASAAVAIKATGDLTLFKQSAPGEVIAGEAVTYLVDVSSGQPSMAANVVVKDDLAPEFIFDAVHLLGGSGSECSYASGPHSVTCALGNLPPGTHYQVQINGRIRPETPAGIVSNSAMATSDSAPPAKSTASTEVRNEAQLSAVKRSSSLSPQSGEVFFYTVEVSNHGPSLARNVRVLDVLSDQVNYLYSRGITCSENMNAATCSLGDLAVGRTVSFDIVVQVATAVREGYRSENVIEITSSTPLSGGANLYAYSEEIVFRNIHDLQIRKFGKPDGSVDEGQRLEYTIVVDNFGPGTAYNSEVIDLLASDGAYSYTAPDYCTPSSGDFSGSSQIVCALDTIAPGEQKVFTMAVIAHEAQSLNNQADVAGDGTDLNPGNNHAIVEHEIIDLADVNVAVEAIDDIVLAGEDVVYSIEIGNNGPSLAQNVSLLNILSGNAVAVNIETTKGSCTLDPLACGLGSLAPGQGVEILLTAATNPALTSDQTVVNNVMVTAETYDNDNSNNQGFDSISVTAARSMRLVMDSSVSSARPADRYNLTVMAINEGDAGLEDVLVNVALTDELVYISDTLGCGSDLSGCNLGEIKADQQSSFSIRVQVSGAAEEGSAACGEASAASSSANVEIDDSAAKNCVLITSTPPPPQLVYLSYILTE